MKVKKCCSECGNITYKNIEEQITFVHDGKLYTEIATRYNDAFYEITKGIMRGSLVHIFDIIKQ
jgi:hypothetical protein